MGAAGQPALECVHIHVWGAQGEVTKPALECVHIHVWAAQGEVTREATRESREHVGHDCAGALGEESIERPEAWERRVQPCWCGERRLEESAENADGFER